jgi:hypothetical protein
MVPSLMSDTVWPTFPSVFILWAGISWIETHHVYLSRAQMNPREMNKIHSNRRRLYYYFVAARIWPPTTAIKWRVLPHLSSKMSDTVTKFSSKGQISSYLNKSVYHAPSTYGLKFVQSASPGFVDRVLTLCTARRCEHCRATIRHDSELCHQLPRQASGWKLRQFFTWF